MDDVPGLTPRKNAGYGWMKDPPDGRDFVYAAEPQTLSKLPTEVDLRPKCPPVYDQGQLGSCTANAIAGALEFDQMKQKQAEHFTPSRLFIYWNERYMEGTVDSDSGAFIRDGVKSVAKIGAPPETDWPYDISRFAEKPPEAAYDNALAHQAISYRRVPRSLQQMKACLASGLPFVFGFVVYESFESAEVARSGRVPMPRDGEAILGGHAVKAVGYRDEHQRFICRNSWNTSWGHGGYFSMPYPYLMQPSLSDDFWVIRTVE